MATKEASGYDLHWVEDPPDDLKCLICLRVARDPQQHPGDDRNACGKIFCLECITKYRKRNRTCPHCQEHLNLTSDVKNAEMIKALKVKCQSEANGCDWTGKLGYLETHLQSCDYTLVPCTNQCNTENEITKFQRTHLHNHLANECPRRQYECLHCQETGEHQEITTSHLDTCQRYEIPCPNADCQDKIPRCEVDTHRSTCPYEPVSCKYAAVGCEEKPLRKDLTEHESNSQIHLQVTTEKVLELTQLLQRVTVLEHKYTLTPPCTVRLANYQKRKRNGDEFYSIPFYTSSNGYKMRLKIVAGGENIGAGTHVSVYACLMKGDNDDTLTWPFTGVITIELLNQVKDKHHYGYKQVLPTSAANGKASQRKVESNAEELRYGWSMFISHSVLEHNVSANTQYLKNNTLVFRVSVETPNYKPWLESTV